MKFRVSHHWSTVVEVDDIEKALDEATSMFLDDYNLTAFGMDLRDSMRAEEIKE